MKFPLLVAILSLSLATPPAYAAVKIKPSKPKISGASQAGSGDQISDFVMNKTLIVLFLQRLIKKIPWSMPGQYITLQLQA